MAIMGGWLTRNEARKLENLQTDEEELDGYLVPLNMGVVGAPESSDSIANGAPTPTPGEEDDEQQNSRLERLEELLMARTLKACERLVKRIVERAKRSATDPQRLEDWIVGDLQKQADVFLNEFGCPAADPVDRMFEQISLELRAVAEVGGPTFRSAALQVLRTILADWPERLARDIEGEDHG